MGKNRNELEFIERIADGFFALDKDGHFTYINKQAAASMQLDPEKVTGQLIWSAFPQGADEPFYKACVNAMAKQQYQCLESYDLHDERWTEHHFYPSGTGLSVLFRDITDRKKTEENLRKTELRYQALIEQASDAIMITDKRGNFLDVNPSLCRMFGYTKEELLQLNINALIDPEQLKVDPIQNDKIVLGQSILRERRMLHRDKSIIEVEVSVKLIPDGRILAVARDITERKKAAEQILREKELSESIINSMPGIFLMREFNGKVLRWNKRLETITGYSAKEVSELKELDFFEGKDKVYLRRKLEKVYTEGNADAEAEAVTKTGEKIPFYFTSRSLEIEGKPCYIAIGLDISERKKTENDLHLAYEQLRNLSSHLQNIREDERKAIAREIHDELGQQLTGLKMDLSWVMKKNKEDEIIFRKLSGMNKLIDQTIETVRRISSELRPSILDDLGLADAMDWMSTEFEKRYRIKTSFQCPAPEMNLDPNIVSAVFRIYQESLTNVARHASAKSIKASLQLRDNTLILHVEDDGKGFDTRAARNKGSFGLIGIEERTVMMGGQFSINSHPGRGTHIAITVPVP